MKNVLASILSVAMLSGMFTLPVSASAAKQDYTYEAKELYNIGMLKGTDRGLELDKTLTRAEAVTILIRAMGLENKALEYTECDYEDIPADSYSVPYVALADEINMIQGTTVNNFYPNTIVTGDQFANMAVHLSKFPGSAIYGLHFLEFHDLITRDDSEGMSKVFTRGDMAKIIYNFRKNGYFLSEQFPMTITEKTDTSGMIWKYSIYTDTDGMNVLKAENTSSGEIQTYQTNSTSVRAAEDCLYFVSQGEISFHHHEWYTDTKLMKLNFNDMTKDYTGEEVTALTKLDMNYCVTEYNSARFSNEHLYFVNVLPAGHSYHAVFALDYIDNEWDYFSMPVWHSIENIWYRTEDSNTDFIRIYSGYHGEFSGATFYKTKNKFKINL